MFALGALALAGCASQPVAVNGLAAHAMNYRELQSHVRKQSPAAAKALERLRQSDEHKYMQQVMAGLPADMRECLVLELIDLVATDDEPVVICVFQTEGDLGYVTNVTSVDGESKQFTGRGWESAVWELEEREQGKAIIPEDLGQLLHQRGATTLPGILLAPAADGKTPAQNVLVVLTYVDHQKVYSVAAMEGHQEAGLGDGPMIRWTPPAVQRHWAESR